MSVEKASAWEVICYLTRLFGGSSIGRKVLMAVTGLGLAGFLIFHLIGNSFLLKGEAAFNSYSKLLHSIPPLPIIEIGLGVFFLVHVAMGIILTYQNFQARPVGYQIKATAGSATVASRSMIYTGGAILLFISYHLWTLHAGQLPHETPWLRVQSILTNPVSVAIYAMGFFALGTHLFHGFSSILVTFGLRHRRHDALVDWLCRACAFILALGFTSLAFCCFLR